MNRRHWIFRITGSTKNSSRKDSTRPPASQTPGPWPWRAAATAGPRGSGTAVLVLLTAPGQRACARACCASVRARS